MGVPRALREAYTPHDHQSQVPGCFRCDLGAEEAKASMAMYIVVLVGVGNEVEAEQLSREFMERLKMNADSRIYEATFITPEGEGVRKNLNEIIINVETAGETGESRA